MICIYTFEAFSLPTELPSSVDFVCFQNSLEYSSWIQKPLPLDILAFSTIRQSKIIKLLPWKYLAEYDHAIYVSSEQDFQKALSLLESIKKDPQKDVYVFSDYRIPNSFSDNLNVCSQLEKYSSTPRFSTDSFQDTSTIAFNCRSTDFKRFSISWMNEVLKESLVDEISFSWLLLVSNLNICEVSETSSYDAFFKIVIPNYNNGSALEECLQSILSQTFQDFKIVIVDDCSTDVSKITAKQYSEEYPDKIYLVESEHTRYSGHARNVGINFNKFSSNYTWFVDGDDKLYSNNVLKILYEKVCISHAELISFDCIYSKNKAKDTEVKHFSVPDFSDPKKALDQFGIAPWHRIIKTEKVVPFFENCIRRQDLATVFRQYANCKSISHLNQICYLYNSRDYGQLNEQIWSRQSVFLEMKRQIADKSLPEEIRSTIDFYLKKYPKIFGPLEEKNPDEQIVVALASYPKRKEGMVKVVKQMLPQCDYLCLYLNEYDEVPQEIIDLPDEDINRISIVVNGTNYKDYGKFYWFGKFPGYYLTVDDDLDYPKDYCEKEVAELKKLGRDKVAVGLHGNDFTIVDNAFVVKKTCHGFASEEKIAVPIDCIGTGAACFYPTALKFRFEDLEKEYFADNDLDMTVSIFCKTEGKMLYRIPSRKKFIGTNGYNLVNPLAKIHFAWEKRYVQYDKWLKKSTSNEACAICCMSSKELTFEMLDVLYGIETAYKARNVDFFFIPLEDNALLADSDEMWFVKFEFVKMFLDKYRTVTVHPLKEKELEFSFEQSTAEQELEKIWKVKAKKLKRMSDKILKANLKKM